MPAHPIHFADLGLSPVALDLGGPFVLRWYALSYLAMLALGWWYLRRLVARPGAPMTPAQVDDALTWVGLGVILGGRLGYCLFYQPGIWLRPWKVLELWHGGMSFHGGLIGVLVALWWFARRNRLDLVRIYDYVACAAPFGMILVRLANFVNGELWGRPSSLPWAMIFPGSHDGVPRHPSQLYEAALEGGLMMLVLVWMFWRTDARNRPGRLAGTALLLYGTARFFLEFTRQPDAGLEHLAWGLTMGQTLCVPMIAAGVWLLMRSASLHVPAPAAASGSPRG
ncbi:prolipoprotein diacylglyceryl transferase [Sphingomonas sp. DG1-23]|jgi:phosphatidylglycerol:prolipoprotein diacylglycerol transferase|uniref:prolipoprotein diacylglyceryl transferase n=1 Tax=Sphingomonas sp. DG1-23 TaxID=3068316 RepID=UPI00273E4457|nr:prolipoprotein diacylglyceryl transferase [Sphingomonas sp. DG1-23]MDP5279997.1 prolipoprotein diacylglyceryl transferase [Sphingomonas sp. DG1-23]